MASNLETSVWNKKVLDLKSVHEQRDVNAAERVAAICYLKGGWDVVMHPTTFVMQTELPCDVIKVNKVVPDLAIRREDINGGSWTYVEVTHSRIEKLPGRVEGSCNLSRQKYHQKRIMDSLGIPYVQIGREDLHLLCEKYGLR